MGLLWEKFKPDYPICKEVAPLSAVIEKYDDKTQATFGFQEVPPLPRIWFIHKSDEAEVLEGLVKAVAADVVVMTQACDLEHQKVSNVILCPQIPINEYYEYWKSDMETKGYNPSRRAWNRHCNEICDGFLWNLSMLNKDEYKGETRVDILIVNFHEVFTVPRSFLESLLAQRGQERHRLLPPYREHLSQAFARFFMRVGLPVPIEKNWEIQQQ